MKTVKAIITAAGVIALGANAYSATNVTISSVTQRWPWNNKVDITYTVEGGQTRAAGVYCGLRFALLANGQTYAFDGATVGASAEDGTHTVTWTAPQGIVTANGSMTATLFTTNVPSGNDYMIIDLTSGDIIYEGLFAAQSDSNARYNTDEFKTTKMVLRKIPKWADRGTLPNASSLSSLNGYPTGDDEHCANVSQTGDSTKLNGRNDWQTDHDYYIGVFAVTVAQYNKVYLNSSSTKTPQLSVSWDVLRDSETAPTSSIPTVATAGTGTFFQRLKYLTGNKFAFDFPTEVMFEIAERAGATTTYFWGDDFDADYVVYSGNSGGNFANVGTRKPNAWGLYDMAGNAWEWCLDAISPEDLKDRPSAFEPYWVKGSTNCRYRGGATKRHDDSAVGFYASRRAAGKKSNGDMEIGFRVSMIAE